MMAALNQIFQLDLVAAVALHVDFVQYLAVLLQVVQKY
jgi:hypothetical protein